MKDVSGDGAKAEAGGQAGVRAGSGCRWRDAERGQGPDRGRWVPLLVLLGSCGRVPPRWSPQPLLCKIKPWVQSLRF